MIKKHVNYLLEQKPEKVVVLEMRSHVSWYLKGIPGGAEIKRKLSSIKTIEELNNLLDNFLKETKNDGE